MAQLTLMALAACSPAFNWREVQPAKTTLRLLLPCKPDYAEKVVPLGGPATTLHMLGCDAGGATFALSIADLEPGSDAAAVLSQWQNLTLTNMQAPLAGPNATSAQSATQVSPLAIKGAAAQPGPWRVVAQGKRADGKAVAGQAAYFAHGTQVFQAVLYAEQINREVAETFFASLRFE